MFKIQNKTEGKVQRVLSPPPTTILPLEVVTEDWI